MSQRDWGGAGWSKGGKNAALLMGDVCIAFLYSGKMVRIFMMFSINFKVSHLQNIFWLKKIWSTATGFSYEI